MDSPVCFGGEHRQSLIAVGQLSLSALPGSLNGQCSASVGHLGMDEVVQFVCWQVVQFVIILPGAAEAAEG